LDADTRQYLAAFVDAGGQGLRGRGADLRRVLQASQPTFARSARIGRAVADRRAKVRRLVTNLKRLAFAAAVKDRELGRLVDSTTPGLVDAGHALNHVVNELAYNPPGKEEGYLFWLPWFVHNSNSVVSIEDAHGAAFRGLVLFGCSSVPSVLAANPALLPFF